MVPQETMVSRSFPQLANRKGIFTWINPVGGMGSSPQEMYAPETNSALIAFKMKKKLRILVLESEDGGRPQEGLDLSGVDVIFHTRQWSFHEFIILNPDAIESFTADPAALSARVKESISRFEANDWTNNDASEKLVVAGDLYINFGKLSENFGKVLLPRIEDFLKNGSAIPKLFKIPPANVCNHL